ncbi:delta-9 acyl-lipid desaturase 2-like [Bidens hawaiensis]|uniref:delta-9 acyl-lipid desaturase 2-like n=1 Tax=Bidens hawaiensis TaxID=980011 RepID=UPI004048F506
MSLTLYSATFPTTINNKWRIPQIPKSCFNATSSTKLNVNRTPNHVTRATSATHETLMTVLEKKRNRGFWFRDWDKVDVTHLSLMIGKHVLAVFAPFVLNWGAFWVMVVLSIFTGIGVTLGYHRLLTHRSFKLPKWLEYFFAYCGVHAGQRDPIFWVSVHKNHHKYTDTEKDPHSPREGFWFSHIGWFHYNEYLATKCGESKSGQYSNVPELKAQWFYRFLHDTYVWHTIGLGTLLYVLGGFPYLAWGMGMRAVMVNHFTFFATSVCHIWGERPWKTPDTSTNNCLKYWWVAFLTFGEGWHNNHHAFPSSACHGMEWWQLDLTLELIKFLEMVGLAKDVWLPTEAEKTRMMSS